MAPTRNSIGKTYALTGTPGTGKSSAGSLISQRAARSRTPVTALELSELAMLRDLGSEPLPNNPAARRSSRSTVVAGSRAPARPPPRPVVEVDLEAASRLVTQRGASLPVLVVMGHLAHFLPVDAVLLLRCRPSVLGARLRQRGDPEADIRANMEAEWTDLILFESLATGVPVFEHDTTRETPAATARWIRRVLRGAETPRHGIVDWLADDPPAPGPPSKPISGA